MNELRDTVHVNVQRFSRDEEGDVGYPYFVASCVEITATTDGRTLEELFHNIREMIEVYLESEDTPRLLITMELPYAQTA